MIEDKVMSNMPNLRIVGLEPKKKLVVDLSSKPVAQVEQKKNVPEHKRKQKWEPWSRTKSLPISLDGIKSYYVTLRSESGKFAELLIWTKHPVVSIRRICSKPRSIRDIMRLNRTMVDDINL